MKLNFSCCRLSFYVYMLYFFFSLFRICFLIKKYSIMIRYIFIFFSALNSNCENCYFYNTHRSLFLPLSRALHIHSRKFIFVDFSNAYTKPQNEMLATFREKNNSCLMAKWDTWFPFLKKYCMSFYFLFRFLSFFCSISNMLLFHCNIYTVIRWMPGANNEKCIYIWIGKFQYNSLERNNIAISLFVPSTLPNKLHESFNTINVDRIQVLQ